MTDKGSEAISRIHKYLTYEWSEVTKKALICATSDWHEMTSILNVSVKNEARWLAYLTRVKQMNGAR